MLPSRDGKSCKPLQSACREVAGPYGGPSTMMRWNTSFKTSFFRTSKWISTAWRACLLFNETKTSFLFPIKIIILSSDFRFAAHDLTQRVRIVRELFPFKQWGRILVICSNTLLVADTPEITRTWRMAMTMVWAWFELTLEQSVSERVRAKRSMRCTELWSLARDATDTRISCPGDRRLWMYCLIFILSYHTTNVLTLSRTYKKGVWGQIRVLDDSQHSIHHRCSQICRCIIAKVEFRYAFCGYYCSQQNYRKSCGRRPWQS